MAKYIKDFRSGDTKTIQISYKTDITGYQFRLTLLEEFGKKAALVINTIAGDHAADIPAEGLAFIVMNSEQSATVKPNKYFYFVQRIIAGTPEDILTIMPPIKDYKDKVPMLFSKLTSYNKE